MGVQIVMVSLAQLQEVPPESMILLVGPPGAGKSTFCQQAALHNLAVERPIIYVTTESSPSKAEAALKERGLGEIEPGLLNFIDAYNETVGLSVPGRPDTVHADCSDLSSIGIAISKLQERMGKKGVLLVFDSLISPYLLSGQELMKFLRLTLSRFAAEGNSVLACMDEGCSKEEDLGALMSLSNGVLRMEVEEQRQLIDVVKHPKLEATRIIVHTGEALRKRLLDFQAYDRKLMRDLNEKWGTGVFRKEVGDYVSVFWMNFALWSSMLWDPKRFPTMSYDLWVEYWAYVRELVPLFPWHVKLLFKLMFPADFSKVKDMKKPLNYIDRELMKRRRYGIMEHLTDVSKTNEHYVRVYESYDCSGFENVGTNMASMIPPILAGICKGLEKEEREWNAIETKCVGLGDPYCEFRLVPGRIDGLEDSLRKDTTVIERIGERLMDRLAGFLFRGTPLVERPRLGSDFLMGLEIFWPALARERYRMAFRVGGTKAGRELGERVMDAGMDEDEAVKRVVDLLRHCKVGAITMNDTIEIRESCESYMVAKFFPDLWEEPSCFFTTGFLNGFFSAVKGQHVKETKCVAIGDPYCEWEFG